MSLTSARPDMNVASSDKQEIFRHYVEVVNALQTYCNSEDTQLWNGETLTQYTFSYEIKDTNWLRNSLPPLFEALFTARFRLVLKVAARDFEVDLRLRKSGPDLVCDFDTGGERDNLSNTGSSPEIIAAYHVLQDVISDGASAVSIEAVHEAINGVITSGGQLGLMLELFLDKKTVNQRLSSNTANARLTSFLFAEALLLFLENCTLARLEHELSHNDRRAVIVVFGMSGLLQGDFLVVCGQGHEDLLDEIVTTRIKEFLLDKNHQVLDFRRSESIWIEPTSWLTPSVFCLTVVDPIESSGPVHQIAQQLAGFQALLTILFLADNVEPTSDGFLVEFRGFGRRCFHLKSDSPSREELCPEQTYRLFDYCYDGLRPDKLEITQQFLSLLATDVATFCDKADDVRKAAKKTYESLLVDKVKDYFEARQKIQDRIRGAVDATAVVITDLSREVSSDLYKTSGLILAAVIGVLVNSSLTLWAGLLVALTIALYLVSVLRFGLPTLILAQNQREKQNEAYIKSFNEVLQQDEIDRFVNDQRLEDARSLFLNRSNWAKTIYRVILLFALLVAGLVSVRLLQQNPQSPPSPSPVATPTSAPPITSTTDVTLPTPNPSP